MQVKEGLDGILAGNYSVRGPNPGGAGNDADREMMVKNPSPEAPPGPLDPGSLTIVRLKNQ